MTTLSYTKYKQDPNSKGQRYGQWFINRYIPLVIWPELFYCEDVKKCDEMISKWLFDHQYFNEMPPERKWPPLP